MGRGPPDRLEGEPDLILATGDMIDDDSGIDPLLEALAGFQGPPRQVLRARLPRPLPIPLPAPTKYFRQKPESPRSPLVDTPRLEAGLQGQGGCPLRTARRSSTPLTARSGSPVLMTPTFAVTRPIT